MMGHCTIQFWLNHKFCSPNICPLSVAKLFLLKNGSWQWKCGCFATEDPGWKTDKVADRMSSKVQVGCKKKARQKGTEERAERQKERRKRHGSKKKKTKSSRKSRQKTKKIGSQKGRQEIKHLLYLYGYGILRIKIWMYSTISKIRRHSCSGVHLTSMT